MQKDLHEENRLSWNAAVVAHNSHKGDQGAYFRNGGDVLFPEELELLGDMNGKRVVHLQCNCGQDTLGLARRGAIATGVDIGDTSIDFARRLSAESGIPATFVRSDIYDWFDTAAAGSERYDIAFASYGALCWLSDLKGWARGVSAILVPGGRVVIMEFHPIAMMFDEKGVRTLPYFMEKPLVWNDGISDYVAFSGAGLVPSGYQEGIVNFKNPHRSHEFTYTIGDLLSALLSAGLRIEIFREFPYSNGWKPYEQMKSIEGRRTVMPDGVPNLPLMFGCVARLES